MRGAGHSGRRGTAQMRSRGLAIRVISTQSSASTRLYMPSVSNANFWWSSPPTPEEWQRRESRGLNFRGRLLGSTRWHCRVASCFLSLSSSTSILGTLVLRLQTTASKNCCLPLYLRYCDHHLCFAHRSDKDPHQFSQWPQSFLATNLSTGSILRANCAPSS